MKEQTKKVSDYTLTRVETYGTQGFPDVVACSPRGFFHMIELKHQFTKKVELSPHQVAFQSRNQHASVWTLIKKSTVRTSGYDLYLYQGEKAMDLKMEGLDVPPDLHIQDAHVNGWGLVFDVLDNWEEKLCS